MLDAAARALRREQKPQALANAGLRCLADGACAPDYAIAYTEIVRPSLAITYCQETLIDLNSSMKAAP